jgi:hypothetical protein
LIVYTGTVRKSLSVASDLLERAETDGNLFKILQGHKM